MANCIFPSHQATLLKHWMVYNHAWPLPSPGCRQINWKWTQIKRNSSSLGMNGKWANIFLCSLRETLVFKTYPAKSARNRGLIFDKNFQLLLTYIGNLQFIYLPHPGSTAYSPPAWSGGCKVLANALVSSRFDYCNSLLSGIAETDRTKLQRILNGLAHVVTKSPPFTHSVPLLRSLQWLPVKYRVYFKICFLTYKALHEEQPVYLRSLIAIPLPSRSLRSNRGITLAVPRIKTNTGARAFSSCAPSFWNNLPLSVRSATSVATFRRRLKRYLFDLGFPPLTPVCPKACWCYGIASRTSHLNTRLTVTPLSLVLLGILALKKFQWLIIDYYVLICNVTCNL